MDIDELLQRRFYEYNGKQFQLLFYEIMKSIHKEDFDMPNPYGNLGDMKCGRV